MARTVGFPAALATMLLLDGELSLSGCHIPTEPLIYDPILTGLERAGIRFVERIEALEAGPDLAAGIVHTRKRV